MNRNADKSMIILVVLLVTIVALAGIIKTNERLGEYVKEHGIKENYYYTKGTIAEKYTTTGLLGSSLHYMKFSLEDGTEKVQRVNPEYYMLFDKDDEIFIILSDDMQKITEIKLTEQELNEYTLAQAELNKIINKLD